MNGDAIARRAVLGGMMALAGCAGQLYGSVHTDPGPPFALPGPSRLRIAIFEIAEWNFPFHTGLIIHSPEERIIYDPAGYWYHRQARRIRDVIHGVTPEIEADYLSRLGTPGLPVHWILHLFEGDLPDAVARQAISLARARESAPPGACVLATTSLMRRLPGFGSIPVSLVARPLIDVLRARHDLHYTRGEIDQAPSPRRDRRRKMG